MPYTTPGAFNLFQAGTVGLESAQTDQARRSRDYLVGRIEAAAAEDASFPTLTSRYVSYGSFARTTKIRPLDDIDFLLLLNGTHTTAVVRPDYGYWLQVGDASAPLARFPDGYGYVDSTKILNRIRSSLQTIPSYSKAELKRDGQAVRLDLASYDWSFDIVPAVPIATNGETVYYLIPDGSGNWIATDPRIDAANTTRVNQAHSGQTLSVIRALKYWNNRTHKPRLRPYYFETLALRVFEAASAFARQRDAISHFFAHAPSYVRSSCPDPKALGTDLDKDVSYDTKAKVCAALETAATNADYALMYERSDDHERAIYWWRQVFGSEFPHYG